MKKLLIIAIVAGLMAGCGLTRQDVMNEVGNDCPYSYEGEISVFGFGNAEVEASGGRRDSDGNCIYENFKFEAESLFGETKIEIKGLEKSK